MEERRMENKEYKLKGKVENRISYLPVFYPIVQLHGH